MNIREVLKPFRNSQSERDGAAGRELKELVADWGGFRISSRPANYFESHRLITKHLCMWDLACRRGLRRLELLAYLEEVSAPDILIKNQVRLIREAVRYLIYATRGLSFNIFFRDYRPVKKHEIKYFRWLETKIKFDGLTAKESVMFWSGFLLHGQIRLGMGKDRVQLAFYYPHGEAPLGLKRAIVASRAKRPAPFIDAV